MGREVLSGLCDIITRQSGLIMLLGYCYETDVYMTFFNTKVVYIYIKRKSSKLILILLLETTKCIEKLMIKPGKLASVDSPPQVF